MKSLDILSSVSEEGLYSHACYGWCLDRSKTHSPVCRYLTFSWSIRIHANVNSSDDLTHNTMMMKSQRKIYNWVGPTPLFSQQRDLIYYRHIQRPMSGKHDIHNTQVSP